MNFKPPGLSYTVPIIISLLAPVSYAVITGIDVTSIENYLIFSVGFYFLNLGMTLYNSFFVARILGARKVDLDDKDQWLNHFITEKSKEIGLKKPPRIYIKESDEPNALAIGYKFYGAIVINSSLLKFSQECVEGVLAHELAHIELGHTFTINFVHNFFEIPKKIFSLYLFLIKSFFSIIGIVVPIVNVFGQLCVKAYELLWNLYVKGLTFIVNILFNGLSRHQEKEADLRAIHVTKHLGIVEFFEFLSQFEKEKKFIKVNFSTHPESRKRIEYCTKEARLLELV